MTQTDLSSHSPLSRKAHVTQFIKYCCVGVINTLVCLGVIFLCKSVFGINQYVSNAIGYVCGVINSFLWNKQWVFKSNGKYTGEAIKFVIGFAICYALQFVVVWALSQSDFGKQEFNIYGFVISGYGIATLLGNVVYTLANFVYNKLVAFK
jgi:putative flippase GtrA